jgi:hypothetical protein
MIGSSSVTVVLFTVVVVPLTTKSGIVTVPVNVGLSKGALSSNAV